MKFICFALLVWVGLGTLQAQDTTAVRRDTTITPSQTPDNSASDLLAGLADSTEKQELLPHKMIFTQRIFWGPKGLLRTMNVAPLTSEGRIHELKVRRTMLVAHQIGGFLTLAGFVTQGILGAKLYNAKGQDYVDTKKWHERTATFINISYGTTLALSLTAPPPIVGPKRGFTTIKLHRYLAIVHLAGMITTNILAGMIEDNSSLKPYHRAAAYTTFGAYAASILALKF
ncbi:MULTISPECIES: hypothetical protein [unclassified Spirosoma]|uniref:hypothetical protein n=1 Tax=unclassified Spirosoma TaxID=2621999 RepID=UPI00096203A0|nr:MULTISPECIES: hypothetical protein [unclassified Spirosoma]MBN8824644.1 hypothetical protein [Spirosoma sp.]OJW78803.1 MAG: hypothetical protein BGO59_09995 [Spirosoma sp. 48-14]